MSTDSEQKRFTRFQQTKTKSLKSATSSSAKSRVSLVYLPSSSSYCYFSIVLYIETENTEDIKNIAMTVCVCARAVTQSLKKIECEYVRGRKERGAFVLFTQSHTPSLTHCLLFSCPTDFKAQPALGTHARGPREGY